MKFKINCDLGEGLFTDAELMPYLDQCNIACGGHYGTTQSMTQTIQLAIKHNVLVGAHPSFPDIKNFGRKVLAISPDELADSLYNQITHFIKICSKLNIKMNHIKLHGALYNSTCIDKKLAQLVLDVYLRLNLDFILFVPYQSTLANLANGKFLLAYEAFIDRRYNSDLTLVNRTHINAMIDRPLLACKQVSSIVNNGYVTSLDGKKVKIKADTLCLHGDNPNALNLIHYLKRQCQ